jgi:PIN domain nuclease of toxin-antitoxin system
MVLDASALLAYLLDEAGAGEVEQALADEAVIGAVNLAEVLSKLSDGGEDPDSAMGGITVLPLEVVPFDEDLAVESARLRPHSASAGLSLGDRACLALGRRLARRVLTADGAWVGLIPNIDVVALRKR